MYFRICRQPFLATSIMLSVPLAYKYVVVAAMIAEINYCAGRLHLSGEYPIRDSMIRNVMVFDPSIIGFAGRVDTDKFSFAFAKSGRLRFIIKRDDGRVDMSVEEYLDKLSQIRSNITESDAYRIATNSLRAIDVDVEWLERDYPAIVKQERCVIRKTVEAPAGEKLLPIFDIRWGDWSRPIVDMKISGVSGEVLKLRQEEDRYSERPPVLVRESDKLLSISDDEFYKYSDSERSNLLRRFSAITYAVLDGHTNTYSPQTNEVSRISAAQYICVTNSGSSVGRQPWWKRAMRRRDYYRKKGQETGSNYERAIRVNP
jgi:hypothetical protein